MQKLQNFRPPVYHRWRFNHRRKIKAPTTHSNGEQKFQSKPKIRSRVHAYSKSTLLLLSRYLWFETVVTTDHKINTEFYCSPLYAGNIIYNTNIRDFGLRKVLGEERGFEVQLNPNYDPNRGFFYGLKSLHFRLIRFCTDISTHTKIRLSFWFSMFRHCNIQV